jgi:two-component system, NtrC family, sensor kinase
MKCPRCQHENPSHAKFCLECGVSFSNKCPSAGSHTDLQRALSEAPEQQTATSEILRVISQSPTDVQPVFNAIAELAARLCDAAFSAVVRFDGELLHLVAVNNMLPEERAAYHSLFPRRPQLSFVMGRALLDGRPVHIEDVEADPDYDQRTLAVLKAAAPYHTCLGIPILRDGLPIGAIGCARHEVKPFTAAQIELVKTFANQVVIAIENVRLFTELQEKNRALTQAHAQVSEALEQQTATSEILRVISQSPTDVQPVFDAIVRSAVRLCDGLFGGLCRFDGELIYPVATHNYTPDALDAMQRIFPVRPSRTLGVGRAILDRDVVHLPDVRFDPEYQVRNLADAIGFRSGLFVPMLRDGAPIGAILVARAEPGPFTGSEISLLKTFADQAVIAIENVRLFTELQEKNQALTEAHRNVTDTLERQTATSDILRVISNSTTDEQPVFDVIAKSALRLLGGVGASVTRVVGDDLHLAALTSTDPAGDQAIRSMFPLPMSQVPVFAQAFASRGAAVISDIDFADRVAVGFQAAARQRGYRSLVVVSISRGTEVSGYLGVSRAEAGGFTEAEVELLKTFADQAVIAMENVRLFNELAAANRDLQAAPSLPT